MNKAIVVNTTKEGEVGMGHHQKSMTGGTVCNFSHVSLSVYIFFQHPIFLHPRSKTNATFLIQQLLST